MTMNLIIKASCALVIDSLGIFEGRENRWLKSV